MPWRDGTGPEGYGPMTGWGMGNCAPRDRVGGPAYPVRNYSYRFFPRRRLFLGRRMGFGAGYGPGRGMGYGFRRWW